MMQIKDEFKNLSYGERIIKWWNENGFLGYEICDPEGVVDCINDFNSECEEHGNTGYMNVEEMIERHQSENYEWNYEEEIKERGLISSHIIDLFIMTLSQKKLTDGK